MTNKFDVVIAGGGPVGLTTALLLASRGVQVAVLEKEPDTVRTEWRGSTMHPPTMAIFDELGIASTMVEEGVRVDELTYRDLEIEGIAVFDYSLISNRTPFPFRLQYEQYKVLRLLKDRLRDSNVPVFYETNVEGLELAPDGVTAVARRNGSELRVHGSWLVAADGAHSLVRKQLDIPFPGFTYPYQSLVVATEFPLEDHIDNLTRVTYWSGPYGRVSIIRTPDIWRIAITTDVRADEHSSADEKNPHQSYVRAVEMLLGRTVDVASIPLRQHEFYRSHQRVAPQFRVGRVLLAGDAAHLASTTGGMGLNSGIHDAYQIAVAFERDDVDAALDLCAEGRRRVVADLLQPVTTGNRRSRDVTDIEGRRQHIDDLMALAKSPADATAHLVEAAMLTSWELADEKVAGS